MKASKKNDSFRKILIFLTLACLFLFIHVPFFDWWCSTGVAGFFSKIQSSCFYDLVALALAVLGWGVAVMMPKHMSEVGNKWMRVFSTGLVYILLVESFHFNEFFIHFQGSPWFRYSDVVILILVVFLVVSCFVTRKAMPKTKNNVEKEQLLYYDDTDEIDFLKRGQRVAHICKFLGENRGNKKGATGVAITGGWGTGKSWVLEHVKNYLEKEDQLCIVFKPWVYGKMDISRQFYLTLERYLRTQDIKVKELKDAVLEIDNEKMSGMGRFALLLMGIVMKPQGREAAIENIKNKLLEVDRQIYVFIDDCDRLAHDELLQVLSLIRNTGDFPLITYLMAFDEQVVRKTLKDEDGIQYAAKMFNLTEELPPVTDEVIGDYLFQSAKMMTGEKDFSNPYSKIPITHYLPTVREAKKYLNLLKTDYVQLKSRIDKYFFYTEDFCLLELLKYKYSELYYGLRANPGKYLNFEKTGWNSPVGLPIESCFQEDADLLTLMKALFRKADVFADRVGVIGVANQEFFPLYFDREPAKHYLEGEAFIEAVRTETLSQKIGDWLYDDCSGIMGLLCAAYSSISKREMYFSLAEFIWHQCEKSRSINTLNKMVYGYVNKDRHGYKNIRELIAEVPQIHLLAFQLLPEPDEPGTEAESVEQMINESDRTLELMGIWLNELRCMEDLEYPYTEVSYYVEKLWGKLISHLGEDTMSTLNVIDIWADCTSEDAFQKMILPLITENPQRWLGATLARIKNEGEVYYLLKSHCLHAIFGSRSQMDDLMKQIVDAAKEENKEYVNAYVNLIRKLEALVNDEEEDGLVNRQEMLLNALNSKLMPALAESVMIGFLLPMPIETTVNKMKQSPFWQGENLRTHREYPSYYFETEI